ncbi:MAG: alkaline phosphatase family protein [Frankiaceae bacterium]
MRPDEVGVSKSPAIRRRGWLTSVVAAQNRDHGVLEQRRQGHRRGARRGPPRGRHGREPLPQPDRGCFGRTGLEPDRGPGSVTDEHVRHHASFSVELSGAYQRRHPGDHHQLREVQLRGRRPFSQLHVAGITWKPYAQGHPGACFLDPGEHAYARKQVPALYYTRVTDDPAAGGRVVPMSQLDADAAAGRLPSFAMVIPDLDNDMHGVGEARTPKPFWKSRTARQKRSPASCRPRRPGPRAAG